MGSPRPPPEKKGREMAASRGWMRFRRERRAGAAIFGQTEVVHSTKMLPLLHFRPLRPADLVISWRQEKEGQMRHAEGQGEEERARAARLRNTGAGQGGSPCIPRGRFSLKDPAAVGRWIQRPNP